MDEEGERNGTIYIDVHKKSKGFTALFPLYSFLNN